MVDYFPVIVEILEKYGLVPALVYGIYWEDCRKNEGVTKLDYKEIASILHLSPKQIGEANGLLFEGELIQPINIKGDTEIYTTVTRYYQTKDSR